MSVAYVDFILKAPEAAKLGGQIGISQPALLTVPAAGSPLMSDI